jgi:hypothetical protein
VKNEDVTLLRNKNVGCVLSCFEVEVDNRRADAREEGQTTKQLSGKNG